MTKREKAVAAQLEKLKIRHAAAQQFKAWLDEQSKPQAPKAKPVPEAIKGNPAALAAYGYVNPPLVELGTSEAWKQTIAERADRRHGIDTTPAGFFTPEEQEFERSEAARHALATRLLLSCTAPEVVAVKAGYSMDEVRELQKEIGL